MAKKTYRVWAECTSYSYIDIEAESEEEALGIAEDIDGGEFTPTMEGDWSITEAIEQ